MSASFHSVQIYCYSASKFISYVGSIDLDLSPNPDFP